MKRLLQLSIIMLFSACLLSCSSDDDSSNNKTINLPISGTYAWAFSIPNAGNQVSKHTFNNEIIKYVMSGDVYNIAYDMDVLSYDKSMKKIIAKGKAGSGKEKVYFAIFLKDISSASVKIFKAELDTEQAAKEMAVPADNDPRFHGWNAYAKE